MVPCRHAYAKSTYTNSCLGLGRYRGECAAPWGYTSIDLHLTSRVAQIVGQAWSSFRFSPIRARRFFGRTAGAEVAGLYANSLARVMACWQRLSGHPRERQDILKTLLDKRNNPYFHACVGLRDRLETISSKYQSFATESGSQAAPWVWLC